MKPAVVTELAELRQTVLDQRRAGRTIGLVPTMGNLHAGHLSLVEQAAERSDFTLASIFVNPTQFGPGEDFASYPRSLEADLDALTDTSCDLIWAPPGDAVYPLPEPFLLRVPEALGNCLCGRSRPGHFDGVASVVLRLFIQVQPDIAVFGEKDFQQLLIIKQMVRDLSLPIKVHGAPTQRETDGLAMSSRNAYLDARERAIAPLLHRVLDETAAGLAAGGDFAELHAAALERLKAAGFKPDYLDWRSSEDLTAATDERPSRLFAAAWLGQARLIDNIPVVGAGDVVEITRS